MQKSSFIQINVTSYPLYIRNVVASGINVMYLHVAIIVYVYLWFIAFDDLHLDG